MQLRRNVKAPIRYDDESFIDPDRIPYNAVSSPSPPPPPPADTRIRSSLLPKPIEFNPNLPPAAFPTLDSWLPRKSGANDLNSTWNSSSSSGSSSPSLDSNLSPIQTITKAKSTRDFTLPASAQPNSKDMDGSDECIGQESLPMVYLPMTNQEAFMFEMQTSDEEGPSKNMSRRRKRKTTQYISQENGTNLGNRCFTNTRMMSAIKCPKWEELSAAHQIDLVLVLSELHGTTEHAMEKLRLNHRETKAMLDLINQRNEHESKEKARVDAFQQRLNQILLDEKVGRVKPMSQETYRLLVKKHLYDDSKGQEFYLSTAAEFAKAARYLESCGHRPKNLLDHWHDGLGARAVSRFPATAHSSNSRPGRPEQPGRSEQVGHTEEVCGSKQVAPPEQQIVYPDTPVSLLSPQPSTSADSVFNPSLASSSGGSARNNNRRRLAPPRAARPRARRSNGRRK